MKFLAIIYGNAELWASWDEDRIATEIAAQDAFNARYKETGELLSAFGLGDESTAKAVRVRDGVPAVTDGPYIEAREYVGSFYLFEVESEARALELAAEIPFASFNAVEVWPVLHEAPQ